MKITPLRVSSFLAWGDFHARSRFARSTIPEEKWGLLVVYYIVDRIMKLKDTNPSSLEYSFYVNSELNLIVYLHALKIDQYYLSCFYEKKITICQKRLKLNNLYSIFMIHFSVKITSITFRRPIEKNFDNDAFLFGNLPRLLTTLLPIRLLDLHPSNS